MTIRFGVMSNNQPAPGADLPGMVDELIEEAQVAERAGFDSFFVNEHHQEPAGYFPSPFVLLGTVAEMADQVQRNRERWGFSYYTVHGPFREAFAPVIERLRP